VSIEELKRWLKVSEDANSYNEWKPFKRRVITPAVDEINKYAEDGFFVAYEGLRGKSFTKVKFTLAETAERDDRDVVFTGKNATRKGGGT
jgi:hypothetical protein